MEIFPRESGAGYRDKKKFLILLPANRQAIKNIAEKRKRNKADMISIPLTKNDLRS
jgi:hypothetical protein